METKYLVVTGGVVSGLGKGLAAASMGKLISPKHNVIAVKSDGYLNVDPGTMNPIEHGEVYVLDDGTEADMDFGHYERFIGVTAKGEWNLTMGKVYSRIMEAERRGDYGGKTVEMVPHVVDKITEWWLQIGEEEKADLVLLEIGGTVGDMENEMYYEAAKRLHTKLGHDRVMFAHVVFVPLIYQSREQKSRPAQHSIISLGQRGIHPDLIICRCEEQINDEVRRKISKVADIDSKQVVTGIDTANLFEIPVLYHDEGIGEIISKHLKLELISDKEVREYKESVKYLEPRDGHKSVKVAICGKYTGVDDSYASVKTALDLAGAKNKVHVDIDLIETTELEDKDLQSVLSKYDGIIVPGGFGSRGIEGKISVIKYCRENKIPYLGLCYGLQLALVEYARNVCGLEGAHTTEVDPNTKYPIVDILPDKKDVTNIGGTLRLGAYDAVLKEDTKVYKLYGNKKTISERHRHRYEVNPEYHEQLQCDKNLVFSGMSPDGTLVEFIELKDHPFFIATQAHPEFKNPAPLFVGFIKACK